MASSLFAGLFPSEGKSKDDLFTKSGKFRNPQAGLRSAVAAEAPAQTSGRAASQGPRSRDPSDSQDGPPSTRAGADAPLSTGKRGKVGQKAVEKVQPKEQAAKLGKQLGSKHAAKPAATEPAEPAAADKTKGNKEKAGKAPAPKAAKPAKKAAERSAAGKRPAATPESDGAPASKRKTLKVVSGKPSPESQAGGTATESGSPAQREEEGGEQAAAAPAKQRKVQKELAAKPASSAEALVRTVFVGNLPPGTNRKAVRRLMAPCGAVESVRLRSLAVKQDVKMPRRSAVQAGEIDPGRGSGHAYVVFEDVASVDKALALNMTEYEGRHLRVDRATEDRVAAGRKENSAASAGAVVYEPSRSVFLGNLAHNVEDEDVIRFFTESRVSSELKTALEAVRVVRDRKTTLGKGVGFVLFKTRSAARSALLMDGKPLGDRKIRVMRVSAGAATPGQPVWQGTTVTRKGKPAAMHLAPRGAGVKNTKSPAAKRGPGQKRPAVAARKAQQRAQRKRAAA